MVTRSIICMVALSLTACAMGPNYKKPPVQVPNQFRHQPKKVLHSNDLTWWKQFKDPVLDQLIAEALANNKDIKIAAANVEQACGILVATRAQFFPQITYTATGTRSKISKNVALFEPTPNPYNNFQVLGGVNWEIDLWGRIRRLTESARANLLATKAAERGVILSLVAEVGSAYIQLRALDEQLIISQKTLKAYKESLRLFTLQHKYGQVSEVNVAQARSQYETAAATIPQIKIQIVETENALSILLGRNPGAIPRGRRITDLVLPNIPPAIPSQLLRQRPDILQAEQNLIAANALIGANLALYFPNISLTGAYGVSSQIVSNLLTGGSKTWNYGASILGPLFTAGALEGGVIQAEAATKAALLQYKLTIQKAFADVDNALNAREQLKKKMTAQSSMVTSYKRYEFLARHKYDEGYSPYLEVLYAESQLFPAELSTEQTKAALLISAINIYKAMGGSWVIGAQQMTLNKV